MLSSDAPIRTSDEDEFGRTNIAARVAIEAMAAAPDGGFVIALCGPWGSGKSSIGNLAARRLQEDGSAIVVNFNPWLFSGAEDLVARFLGELSATLSKKDGTPRRIAGKLATYAGALSGLAAFIPGAGGPASALLSAAHQVMTAAGEAPTLEERRRDLVEALEELPGRIVVFLDDLDRLTDLEIREIVRLEQHVGSGRGSHREGAASRS